MARVGLQQYNFRRILGEKEIKIIDCVETRISGKYRHRDRGRQAQRESKTNKQTDRKKKKRARVTKGMVYC